MSVRRLPTLRVHYVRQGAIPLRRQHPGDVGYDLGAVLDGEEIEIPPNERLLVCTGVSIQLPPGHEGMVRPRSGLSSIGLVAEVGTIDTSFRGEVKVVLHNRSQHPQQVIHGMRVAQLVVSPVATPEVVEVDALDETERGIKGWGSTGR